MRISELQSKDIVNLKDGRRLGKIIDIEITPEGQILHLIIESRRNIKSFLSTQTPDTSISYSQIKKICTDFILVEL